MLKTYIQDPSCIKWLKIPSSWRESNVLGQFWAYEKGMMKSCSIQGQLCIKWMRIMFSWSESCVLGQFWAYGWWYWNPAFKANYVSNGWKSCFRKVNHMFRDSSGHTAGDSDILNSKPIMYENRYTWKVSCSSGHTARDAEIIYSRPVMYKMDEFPWKEWCVLRQFWANGWGCWNVAFKASYLSNGWKSCFLNNHKFWSSSGRTAWDAEILHSKPVMNQMDENRIFVQKIMRSGTALGIRLGMQLCIKWVNIVFSWRESCLLRQFWAYRWGCWNPAFKASKVSNGWKSCFNVLGQFGHTMYGWGCWLVMHQINENPVFVYSIMRSGTVPGIRLRMLNSCIHNQLCIKGMKSCLRKENHAFWDSAGHTAGDT